MCILHVYRAKVHTLSNDEGMPTGHAVHTFYLVDNTPEALSVDPEKAANACKAQGGIEHEALTEDRLPEQVLSLYNGEFYFSVAR